MSKHNIISEEEWQAKHGLPQDLVDIWEAVGVEKMPSETKAKYDEKKAKEEK